MIYAFTGHRPPKLGGYSDKARNDVGRFASEFLKRTKPKRVISGMALGWDIAIARAALRRGIPLVAAIPFTGQESKWRWVDQVKYREILQEATHVHVASPGGYAVEKMQIRNEWMVDNCDKLIALWDGSDGGTANCIRYAQSLKRPESFIVNLWDEWNEKGRTGRGA